MTLYFASPSIAAPRAVVERPSFDFGTIDQGKSIDHVFMVTNGGDTPLTIGQVSTSCGCTVADVSSRSIAPGKTGAIKTTFNSTNFSGNVSKTVHFHSNDPRMPVYTLTIKGIILERLVVTPKQLDLGEIQAGTRKNILIRIENKGPQPITVISAKTAMPQVTAKIVTNRVKSGATGTISVDVTPRKEDRFLTGYLVITTSSPEKPEITVPVYASTTK
ncbi:MAG: DUF1573 domain-containing protein [Deltaproteobacteria bacterium]